MGLEQRDLAEWLVPRAGDDVARAERKELIRTKPRDVIAALPESRDALVELTRVLEARNISGLRHTGDEAALAALGGALAEDVCVLTRDEGGYRLAAAVLCFPNRWRPT